MTYLKEAELRRAALALSAPNVAVFLPLLGLSPEEASSTHAVARRVVAITLSSDEAALASPRVLDLIENLNDEALAALDLLMWLAAEYFPVPSARLTMHLWTVEILDRFPEHVLHTSLELSPPALGAVEAAARAFNYNQAAEPVQRLFDEADRRAGQRADDPLFTILAMIHQRYFHRFAAAVRRALDEAEVQTLVNWAGGIVGRALPLP